MTRRQLFIIILIALLLPIIFVVLHVSSLIAVTVDMPVAMRLELLKTSFNLDIERQTMATTVATIIGILSYIYGNRAKGDKHDPDL